MDRILLSELAKSLGVILLVMALLMGTIITSKLLRYVSEGRIAVDVVFGVVGLEMAEEMILFFPSAFFFAILWVLGRMNRDGEICVLEASGVSLLRIYQPIFVLSIPLALLMLWGAMELAPGFKREARELRAETARLADLSGIRPGGFLEVKSGELVIYSQAPGEDDSDLRRVLIADYRDEKQAIMLAERATQRIDRDSDERYVVLSDGSRFEFPESGLETITTEFGEYRVRVGKPPPRQKSSGTSISSWSELVSRDTVKSWSELHYRLSSPMVLIALVFLSLPLARSQPRRGHYGRMGLAVLLYFLFVNAQRLGQDWLEDGVIPLWMGMWWLPLAMLLTAAVIDRFDGNRPGRSRLRRRRS